MTPRAAVSAALAGCLLVTACGGDAGTATAPPTLTTSTAAASGVAPSGTTASSVAASKGAPSSGAASSGAASSGAASSGADAQTLTVIGSIALVGPYFVDRTDSSGNTCVGTGGFRDLVVGARVAVTDATDATVGVGTIDSAVAGELTATAPRRCDFSFTVVGVPRGSASYKVKIAGRDGPTYTEAELSRPVVLTLGNG